MILRFTVKNHLSLKDEQELSMAASALTDREDVLITTESDASLRVLPCAIIYGANASGKSNVVDAFRFMKNFVRRSHLGGDPDSATNQSPFLLDPRTRDSDSEFQMDFEHQGARFSYGFSIDGVRVCSEWLYDFPNQKRRMLFNRGSRGIRFGRSLRGQNKKIAELTRENSLFLSTAAQNSHDMLTPVFRFFGGIEFRVALDASSADVSLAIKDGVIDKRIITFLGEVGTGIVSYRTRQVSEETRELTTKIYSFLAETMKIGEPHEPDSLIPEVFELGHVSHDREEVYFDLSRESLGTRRLLILLSAIFKALDSGSALIVDELDASLHTQACEAIISLFSNREINVKGAQLIMTTHDTNLLCSDLVRRDEIWFCEKATGGETVLYPLSDIRVRKGDNIEKGYLQGRFGAVPFSGSVHRLTEKVNT